MAPMKFGPQPHLLLSSACLIRLIEAGPILIEFYKVKCFLP